ncbi:hypothetical protein JCM9534A_83810 [Catenuloplanes indicus JCM 9534]
MRPVVDDEYEWGNYARLSDNKNSTAGSAKRQNRLNRKAIEKIGGNEGTSKIDDDMSAYDKSSKFKPRPGYYALLDWIAEKPGRRGIVAWHTDRLWRTPREFEDFLDVALKVKPLVYIEQSGYLDLETADGRAEARAKVNRARYESEHRSDRVKVGVRELAELGGINGGGTRPYGYNRVIAELGHRRVIVREEINEEEAAVIRHCKDLLLKDGKSMQQVHRWVVGAGHLTVKGNVFTRVRLQKILSSARIAGLREHLGEVTSEAVWPKIIEPEEHQQLRSLLAMKPAAPSSGGRRKYWASGFVFCSDCVVRGIPMSAYKKQERLRWRCDPNNGGCNGRFVGLEEVQAMIGMFVVSMLQNPATARLLAEREAASASRTASIMDRITSLEGRAAVLAGTLDGADDGDVPEVVSLLRGVRRRITEAREELAAVAGVESLREPLPDLAERWLRGDLDVLEQTELCGLFVDKVVIGPGRRSPKFDPERVTIHPRRLD